MGRKKCRGKDCSKHAYPGQNYCSVKCAPKDYRPARNMGDVFNTDTVTYGMIGAKKK